MVLPVDILVFFLQLLQLVPGLAQLKVGLVGLLNQRILLALPLLREILQLVELVIPLVELVALALEGSFGCFQFLLQSLELAILLVFLFLHLSKFALFVEDASLQVLLLFLGVLELALLSRLLIFELFDLVLELLNVVLFSDQVVFKFVDFLHQRGLLRLQIVDRVGLLLALLLEISLLSHKVLDGVVLTDREAGALFDDL